MNTGAGYKDAKEFYAAMKDKRFNYDREYINSVRAKFDQTPASVRDEWNKPTV